MNKIESRHQLIRSLVMENKIHTQQELQELLELNGVEVTQSTLSRDNKLLNLVKITESGSSYYVINSIAPSRWEKRLRFYMEDALVMLKPVQHLHGVGAQLGGGAAADQRRRVHRRIALHSLAAL